MKIGGVISVPNDGVFLAPTYDHASSLGRNETDDKRSEMLNTLDIRGRSVEAYVKRARSKMYLTEDESSKPLFTLDAFFEAAKSSPDGARYWITRLDKMSIQDFDIVLEQIPDIFITQITRDFAKEMLVHNRQRILDGFRALESSL